MKVYGDLRSVNFLKVKYVAEKLGISHEWQEVDVLSGITRSTAFLELNPAGQIPAVDFGDGHVLAQSNAIMRYLARNSSLIPTDPWQAAKMDEWLFWEQYSHEPSIAVVRFLRTFKNMPMADIDARLIAKGNAALNMMDTHLGKNMWFTGNAISLADIALYAYTQFADEGSKR